MIDNGLQSLIEQNFSTLPCMPSGPGALFTFILSNKFLILVQLKSISYASSLVKSIAVSYVDVLENCSKKYLLNTLALATLSEEIEELFRMTLGILQDLDLLLACDQNFFVIILLSLEQYQLSLILLLTKLLNSRLQVTNFSSSLIDLVFLNFLCSLSFSLHFT